MLKLIETERDGNALIKRYDCDFVAECDGTSIWSDTNGLQVHVTGITVIEHDFGNNCKWTQVNVQHDAGWEIYTDSGFEEAISAALGVDVAFTEQGMQEDNYASLESY